jgi:uncharacterized phage-associated protein
MARVEDVAAYILLKRGPMTAMKLQKLCYYSQAWHLVWEEQPLFAARIEAWANGPIVPELYARHRGRFEVDLNLLNDSDPDALDKSETGSIDAVLDSYADLSAHQLSELTHSEDPWLKARERAGLTGLERGRSEITHNDMFEFYDAYTVSGS